MTLGVEEYRDNELSLRERRLTHPIQEQRQHLMGQEGVVSPKVIKEVPKG